MQRCQNWFKKKKKWEWRLICNCQFCSTGRFWVWLFILIFLLIQTWRKYFLQILNFLRIGISAAVTVFLSSRESVRKQGATFHHHLSYYIFLFAFLYVPEWIWTYSFHQDGALSCGYSVSEQNILWWKLMPWIFFTVGAVLSPWDRIKNKLTCKLRVPCRGWMSQIFIFAEVDG